MSGQYQYIINTLTNVNNKHILYNADFYWKQMVSMDKYCNFWITNLIISKYIRKPRNFGHLDHTTLFFLNIQKSKYQASLRIYSRQRINGKYSAKKLSTENFCSQFYEVNMIIYHILASCFKVPHDHKSSLAPSVFKIQ